MATTAQQQQFVTSMGPSALAAAQRITGSQDAATLQSAQTAILSQWAQETGWGTSNAAINLNNFAGIKCFSGCTCGGTYCQYSSPADFAEAYANFMTTQDTQGLYAGVVAALKSGSLSQIFSALSASPWDHGHYSSANWTSISSTIQGLLGSSASANPAAPSALSTGGCTLPSGLTDISGAVAYIQCSAVQDLKWIGVNILMFVVIILLVYFLINDTSAGKYVINQAQTAAKSAVRDAAVAAAA